MTNRSQICTVLIHAYFDKQKHTGLFIAHILEYFINIADGYRQLARSLGKFDLKSKYKDQITYAGLRDAIA